MTERFALRAQRVLADGVERHGWVVGVAGGLIDHIGPEPPADRPLHDLGAVDLVPGLVDLHSDCLELKARPRSAVELPLDNAILELDAELAIWGITTHFLCVCIEDDIGKYRSLGRADETAVALERVASQLRVDHRLHLRVDVTGEGMDTAERLVSSSRVALVSYMVHLPGIGQFPDEASWRRYYTTVEHDGEEALQDRLRRRRARLAYVFDSQTRLAHLAEERGVPLASHDDTTEADVDRARALGVRISEFPTSASAADMAASRGLQVVMGAPNAWRGTSHHGNLSARDAIAAGHASVLASDYHPPSLLAAVYAMAEDGACSWADALALVTEGPAAAAGLDDRGRIAAGRRADLVAVGRRAGLPAVAGTWVAGRDALR